MIQNKAELNNLTIAHRPFRIARPDAFHEWHCLCGNAAHLDGFESCTETGLESSPDLRTWCGLLSCNRCGLLVEGHTGYVVGCAVDAWARGLFTPIREPDGQAEKFIEACKRIVEGFHPDKRFEDYAGEDGPLFEDEIVRRLLNHNLDVALEYLMPEDWRKLGFAWAD
jgi:hypothetical protein